MSFNPSKGLELHMNTHGRLNDRATGISNLHGNTATTRLGENAVILHGVILIVPRSSDVVKPKRTYSVDGMDGNRSA
jgi:hypothetical protein